MIDYQIVARETVTIQGIEMNISAEYKKGKLPTSISAVGNGTTKLQGESSDYTSISCGYSAEERKFTYMNGTYINHAIMQELQTAMDTFYNSIKSAQEEGGMM